MKHSILQRLSFTQLATRVAVITSVSLAMFLLAACDVNAPSNQSNPGTFSGLQGINGLSKVGDSNFLGTASTFAVLGFAGVTNADASLITGDLGAGPGAPSVTGFDLLANTIVYGPGGTVTTGLGIVNGTIYAGGPVENQALNDAAIAYDSLMAQVPDAIYAPVYQLDGDTITPGVYNFPSSANLQVNGTLYLDFQGNNDALFIFQLGSTLVTMANSKIVAINNDNQTCTGSNVYWAVGSSATIDGAEFLGTVIAHTAITMTSAANTPPISYVSGRMFALGASVTMVNSTIDICAGGSVIPPPKPPKPCRDFVTGGGWIKGTFDKKGDDSRATFGVSGGIKNGKYWGQLSFNDHAKKNGVKVKSTSVTSYLILDAFTRQIEGFAKVNGKGSFPYKVIVVDNGEPGRNDYFSLEVSDYSVYGTLKGGNIQLHRKCDDKAEKAGKDKKDDKEQYDDKDERDGHNNCDNGSGRD